MALIGSNFNNIVMKQIIKYIFFLFPIFLFSQDQTFRDRVIATGASTSLVAGSGVTLTKTAGTTTINATASSSATTVNAGTNISVTGTTTVTVTTIPNPTFTTSVTSPYFIGANSPNR